MLNETAHNNLLSTNKLLQSRLSVGNASELSILKESQDGKAGLPEESSNIEFEVATFLK